MSQLPLRTLHFSAGDRAGEVSALLARPQNAGALLILAHGAGAGMRHPFMEHISQKLETRGVATLRYQFPYMEKKTRRPDSEATLTASVRAAVAAAQEHAKGLPIFAGGKSMGGRMSSLAAAREPLEGVRGLIFFGFPLHAAGKPSQARGQHLAEVSVPMLFLQGSRDALADLKLLRPLCQSLGKRAELYVIEGGDHSFHVSKSVGRSDDEILDGVAEKIRSWTEQLLRA
jgi:uncharacterized protein